MDRTDAALRQLEAEYQRRHAADLTAAELERRQAEFNAHMAAGYIADVEAEVNAAFSDGLDEQAGKFRDAVGTGIGTTLGTFFKLLPWWLWLGIAAGAFFWFGGARFLPRRS